MRTRMGSMFRELCRWEVRVRLGWLPIVRIHLHWITWSLRQLEEHVSLCVWPDDGLGKRSAIFCVHDGNCTYYDPYWVINRLSYLYVYGLMMDCMLQLTISYRNVSQFLQSHQTVTLPEMRTRPIPSKSSQFQRTMVRCLKYRQFR